MIFIENNFYWIATADKVTWCVLQCALANLQRDVEKSGRREEKIEEKRNIYIQSSRREQQWDRAREKRAKKKFQQMIVFNYFVCINWFILGQQTSQPANVKIKNPSRKLQTMKIKWTICKHANHTFDTRLYTYHCYCVTFISSASSSSRHHHRVQNFESNTQNRKNKIKLLNNNKWEENVSTPRRKSGRRQLSTYSFRYILRFVVCFLRFEQFLFIFFHFFLFYSIEWISMSADSMKICQCV